MKAAANPERRDHSAPACLTTELSDVMRTSDDFIRATVEAVRRNAVTD